MQFPTLYKTDSKGEIRQWDVKVNDLGGQAEIIVTHGVKDGAKVTKQTLVKSGKNIGKSNETTCLQQAESEAKSKWQSKVDRGYMQNIGMNGSFGLANVKVILPMLAQSFDKHAEKIVFPAFAQPKLDGIRCLGLNVSLASRKGKAITSLPHIHAEVCEVLKRPEFNGVMFLDGELFSKSLTFQTITSIVRKQDPPDNHQEIEYHVYDLHISGQNMAFRARYDLLKQLENTCKFIKVVETVEVPTFEELQRYTLSCVKKGYEGGMVRNANGLYELDKRSYHLQKIKTFQDGEFEIVAGREDKDGGVVFTCDCNGTNFDVRPEGTLAERAKMLKEINDLIGKELTVRYFEMTTSERPVPRFPVGVSIRDYE